MIGRTLKVDLVTSIRSQGRFAQVCVEIDLQLELLPTLQIFRRTFILEYEGLYLVCFNCGIYGHHREACPSLYFHHETPDSQKEEDDAAILKEKNYPKDDVGSLKEMNEKGSESTKAKQAKKHESQKWGRENGLSETKTVVQQQNGSSDSRLLKIMVKNQ